MYITLLYLYNIIYTLIYTQYAYSTHVTSSPAPDFSACKRSLLHQTQALIIVQCNLECSMELSKLNTSDNSTGKLTPQSIQNGINTTAQAQTLLGAQGTHKDTVTHAPS